MLLDLCIELGLGLRLGGRLLLVLRPEYMLEVLME